MIWKVYRLRNGCAYYGRSFSVDAPDSEGAIRAAAAKVAESGQQPLAQDEMVLLQIQDGGEAIHAFRVKPIMPEFARVV